jgi:vanillate O-demethylase monooxygenase subunit
MIMHALSAPLEQAPALPAFPMNRWWVAGFSWELGGKPLARTLLGRRTDTLIGKT